MPPEFLDSVKVIGLPVALCLLGLRWLANFASSMQTSNKELLTQLHLERQNQMTKLEAESAECRRDREELRVELKQKWEQILSLVKDRGDVVRE